MKKRCEDCIFYIREDIGRRLFNACCRPVQTGSRIKITKSCVDERLGNSSEECGLDGRFFKPNAKVRFRMKKGYMENE